MFPGNADREPGPHHRHGLGMTLAGSIIIFEQINILDEQKSVGGSHDCPSMPLPLPLLSPRLMKEEEVQALRVESEELHKVGHELKVRLRKKEWECESRIMERDQHKASVEKFRIKLNK